MNLAVAKIKAKQKQIRIPATKCSVSQCVPLRKSDNQLKFNLIQ